MTEAEAMDHVRRMMIACQKCRSNLMESDLADVSEILTPWLFGDRNILRAIDIVLTRGSIEPQEFWNLMYVAARQEMRVLLGVWFLIHDEPELPEPDLQWLRGWEVAA